MKKVKAFTHGQTLVEFALMLPILMLIVLFLLDAGRGIYYYSVIYNAAREGARYGVIRPDDAIGIENEARQLAIGLDPASLTIASTHDNGTIKVLVTYNFELVTPLVDNFFGGGPLTLTNQSTMIVEE